MTTESRDRRHLWIGIAAVIAAFLVGWLIGRSPGDPEGSRQPDAIASPTTSEAEVVDKAAEYLLAQNACAESVDTCLEVMEDIAAPRWMPQAEQQAREGAEFVATEFGAGTRIETGIVSYRIDNLDPDSADVSFWAVSTFTPSDGTPEAFWGISRLTLELIKDEWLVVAQSGASGPTPESNVSGQGSFNELSGFQPYVGS